MHAGSCCVAVERHHFQVVLLGLNGLNALNDLNLDRAFAALNHF
jgi:hypothetical protein